MVARTVVAGALLALALLAPTIPAAAAREELPTFCQGAKLRDDDRLLEWMVGSKPPPKGELPFGPRNLSMYSLNFGANVVLEGGQLGYRFGAKDAGRRVLRLGWVVRAALRRVDSLGRVLGTVDSTHRRLREVEDLELLEFAFPAKRGLYRFDISFANLRGRELNAYREHFRVVKRRLDLKVAVNRTTFVPGETAYARVLNRGTVTVQLRPGLSLEQAVGDGWVDVPFPPVPERQLEEFRWTLWGNYGSPCVAFPIPPDTAPGAFRFKASALAYGASKRRTLTSGFAVRD